MSPDPGKAFQLAWRIVPRLPEWLVRSLFNLAFDAAWRRGAGGAAQLERNLARVVPEATDRELSRLTRQGMREYGRYYAETFLLPRMHEDEIAVRATATHPDQFLEDVRSGSVVLALGHTGNWDLAGAWATNRIAPVMSVAEVLKPEALFRDFLAFRRSLGMEILPLHNGTDVFRELVRATNAGPRLVALLADRDLTRRGVEVELCGQPARFATGPAALALVTRRPLYFAGVRSDRIEQLHGPRKRGVRIEFIGPIPRPEPGPEAVRTFTQSWVDEMSAFVRRHPASWHMLQKVFTADLDPARLAAREAAG